MTASAQNAPPVTLTRVGQNTEDYADVSVSISGPAGANVGDTVNYNVTITNFGPCGADNICATSLPASVGGNNSLGLVFVSNTGDCTTAYGSCATFRATYNPANECGFAPRNSHLDRGQSFNITSTYTIGALARSVTSVGDTSEVDIVSDTNLINYGTHTQSALADTIVTNETSCSVASTGSSSIAVGLVVLVAYALNRRRRS